MDPTPVAASTAIWLSTEFWSAILGAGVGGVISYALQFQNLREARKIRADDSFTQSKAQARSLLFKLNMIGGHHNGVRRSIVAFRARSTSERPLPPWQFYNKLLQLDRNINFSSDEMGLVLSLKDDVLFNKILLKDSNYNFSQLLIRTLNDSKDGLDRIPQRLIETKGQQAHVTFSDEHRAELHAHSTSIDTTFVDLERLTSDELKDVMDIITELVTKLNAEIKLGLSIQPVSPKNADGNAK